MSAGRRLLGGAARENAASPRAQASAHSQPLGQTLSDSLHKADISQVNKPQRYDTTKTILAVAVGKIQTNAS